jgi:hypothetical protein
MQHAQSMEIVKAKFGYYKDHPTALDPYRERVLEQVAIKAEKRAEKAEKAAAQAEKAAAKVPQLEESLKMFALDKQHLANENSTLKAEIGNVTRTAEIEKTQTAVCVAYETYTELGLPHEVAMSKLEKKYPDIAPIELNNIIADRTDSIGVKTRK